MLLQFKITVFYFKIIIFPVMANLNFQQPLRQSSVSHDHSETILNVELVLKKHLLLLAMLKTVVLLIIFVETEIVFQGSSIIRKFQKTTFI